ncbi:TRAP transporter substrate-binding protein DctP [uncultured Nitratireductor sp.]|uniref:TRAP transporter substrate-binding protein DctP n=1 Tax=uncultured Nitratireductor sp. TaxID=520953 RepID=UPI00260F0DEA|nr:TRAP transporter substrate-binding protein DctP [uncultured Nitratireductor sp.]
MNRFMAAALACAASVIAVEAASAETVLRLSHSYTDGDTRDLWADRIAEIVAEKTGGEVKVEVYPNQQLGKARAQADFVARDRIDMAIYPLPWLSGKVPMAEIGALPGLVASPQDGLVWRERAIWPMLEEAVSEAGLVFAGGGWAMGTIGNKGEAIVLPEDLKGHKVRGLGKATEIMMNGYGATITSLPASEIYQSLQTGVLSGVLTIYASFEGYNLQEVIDHLMVGPGFVGAMHSVLLSPGVEEKIGETHYAALLEAIAESEAWFADQTIADNKQIADAFREAGVSVHELTEEQVAQWHDAAREHAWAYFRESVPNGDAVLKAVDQPRQ